MKVSLIEEPSRVMMCRFLDKNEKRVKIGIEFYSNYNGDCYINELNGLECLDRYACKHFKNGPYLFDGMEGGSEKKDAVLNVPVLKFAIKNSPE